MRRQLVAPLPLPDPTLNPTIYIVRPFYSCHLACTRTPARPSHVLLALALSLTHTHTHSLSVGRYLCLSLPQLWAPFQLLLLLLFFNFGFIRFSVLCYCSCLPSPLPLLLIGDYFGCFAYSSIRWCVCVSMCVWGILWAIHQNVSFLVSFSLRWLLATPTSLLLCPLPLPLFLFLFFFDFLFSYCFYFILLYFTLLCPISIYPTVISEKLKIHLVFKLPPPPSTYDLYRVYAT